MRRWFVAGIAAAAVAGGIGGGVYYNGSGSTLHSVKPQVWVSASGNDTTCKRGGQSLPCATMAKACSLANAGDTIQVRGGTYSAFQQITRTDCNPASQITFRVQPGATADFGAFRIGLGVDGTSTAPNNITLDGSGGTWKLGGVNVNYSGTGVGETGDVIKNLHISAWNTSTTINSAAFIFTRDVGSLTISGNDISGCCDSDGIGVEIRSNGNPNPANVTITGNTLHRLYNSCNEIPTYLGVTCTGQGSGDLGNSGGADHIDGMQVFGSAGLDIERNTVSMSGNHKQGIFLQPANGGTFTNVTIADNMVNATSDNAITVGGPGTNAYSGYVKLLYNTSWGQLFVYNSILVAGTPVTIAGNIVHGYAGNQSAGGCTMTYGDGTTLTPTWSHNMLGANAACGTGDVGSTSPTLVQATFPGAGADCGAVPPIDGGPADALTACQTISADTNLHLSGAQTAVDGGENTYCPAGDADGQSRPDTVSTPCDIGADEVTTGS